MFQKGASCYNYCSFFLLCCFEFLLCALIANFAPAQICIHWRFVFGANFTDEIANCMNIKRFSPMDKLPHAFIFIFRPGNVRVFCVQLRKWVELKKVRWKLSYILSKDDHCLAFPPCKILDLLSENNVICNYAKLGMFSSYTNLNTSIFHPNILYFFIKLIYQKYPYLTTVVDSYQIQTLAIDNFIIQDRH